ncbi:Protein TusB [Buchnera aphidicola (Tetraneura ulmi)]|uniref:sulfurtransferase complex subunit TusB n=1 Tax=Buchnera aphidicola TaxID=9 RepID=UPI003463F169
MLHILLSSPFSCNTDLLFSYFKENDSLIALQDGVIIALRNSVFFRKTTKLSNLYVLGEDVTDRGLNSFLSPHFCLINYNYFVRMTIKYSKYMNW